MERSIFERLRKLNIEPDSDLGKKLQVLDDKYEQITKLEFEIKTLSVALEQLREDVDIMEAILMYKINKDTREYKGVYHGKY